MILFSHFTYRILFHQACVILLFGYAVSVSAQSTPFRVVNNLSEFTVEGGLSLPYILGNSAWKNKETNNRFGLGLAWDLRLQYRPYFINRLGLFGGYQQSYWSRSVKKGFLSDEGKTTNIEEYRFFLGARWYFTENIYTEYSWGVAEIQRLDSMHANRAKFSATTSNYNNHRIAAGYQWDFMDLSAGWTFSNPISGISGVAGDRMVNFGFRLGLNIPYYGEEVYYPTQSQSGFSSSPRKDFNPTPQTSPTVEQPVVSPEKNLPILIISVMDSTSGTNIPAEIAWSQEDTTLASFIKALDGEATIQVMIGKTYRLKVQSDHHFPKTVAVNIPLNTTFPLLKTIYLIPAEIGEKMILRNINFAVNSDRLEIDSYEVLDEIVAFLKSNPEVRLEVSAHTDDTGSESYNQKLSLRRANSVATYLITHGVDKKRIVTKGYGETLPMVPNSSEENRTLNRRVEMKIIE